MPANSTRHPYGEPDRPLHLSRSLPWIAAFSFLLLAATLVFPGRSASAQKLIYHHPPNAAAGKKIYEDGCIHCHGANGDGAPQSDTVFKRPDTWPDFTQCSQTTPETSLEYKAVIVHGGPSRGFSQIMPSFGDLLTDDQINDLVAYLRSFCKNTHHDPLGELNLPRAIVTEKAFPENEVVVSTQASPTGLPSWTTDIIDERTVFDARTQLETDVPVNYSILHPADGGPGPGNSPGPGGGWTEGVGDITMGLKRDMFSSLRTGTILSLQGGVLLPTGDSHRGFGAGTLQFEPFAAFDQLFPENTFVQFEAGADLPWDTAKAPRSLFYRTAIGQGIGQDHMLGRLWAPMVELLARRDFSPGAQTDWDVLPEMQVTLSRRQHIRLAAGWRKPFTDTRNRPGQAEFYLLWDWFDGRFWEGWR
jgi:cytochrome c5